MEKKMWNVEKMEEEENRKIIAFGISHYMASHKIPLLFSNG